MTRLKRTFGVLGLCLSCAGAIATRAAILGPIALTTACQCRDNGSPIILDDEIVQKKLKLTAEGPACETSKLECMQRDKEGRCQVFWIVPRARGTCTVTLQLEEGRRFEDVIEYGLDEDYPCRGVITTEERHVTKFTLQPGIPGPALTSP